MRTIRVDIVSAQAAIYSGEAKLVVVPAVMGELGLLPGHAPLLTRLWPGELRVRPPEGEEMLLYVSGGFLEVQPQVVTILADVALRADDIDEAAALEAKESAEYNRRRAAKAMADGLAVFDYAEAKAELARATAQLKALDDLHKRRRQKRPR